MGEGGDACEVGLRRRIRVLLVLFMAGLVLSGLTAFWLDRELQWLASWMGIDRGLAPGAYSGLKYWIATVAAGLHVTNAEYPFLAYGTDWLAFGHLVIAVAFIGPLRDPVRNVWVVTFGLIACGAVIPLAVIAGAVRDIPLYWSLIDCCFGVVGALILWPVRRYTLMLGTLRSG